MRQRHQGRRDPSGLRSFGPLGPDALDDDPVGANLARLVRDPRDDECDVGPVNVAPVAKFAAAGLRHRCAELAGGIAVLAADEPANFPRAYHGPADERCSAVEVGTDIGDHAAAFALRFAGFSGLGGLTLR
jgi:hypothetical protein